MSVLDDAIYKEITTEVHIRSRTEIEKIREIVESNKDDKEKCQALLDIIIGKGIV